MDEQKITDEERFKQALRAWIAAGHRLVETWSTVDFDADERYPLPDAIKPPISLDDWFWALDAHYNGPHTIDLDKVCRILKSRYNVASYVEQTGGGCATIYAGARIPDGDGEERFQACAGPGWFEGPGWSNGRANTADLSVGPDDDGQADPVVADPDWDEQRVALEIVKVIIGKKVAS